MSGVICHNANRAAVEPAKTDYDVRRIMRLDFKEIMIIDDCCDQLLNIVGFVGIFRDQGLQAQVLPCNAVGAALYRRVFHVVRRQVTQQFPDHHQRLFIIFRDQMGHTAFRIVRHRPAKVFHRHLFMCHCLDHFRACHKHIRRVLRHDDIIGHGRRINSSPRARTKYGRNLRNNTGSHDIPEENVGITRQALHPFLNSRAARIVQPDHRGPHPHRQVHDLHDLVGIGPAQCSPENGKVLGENIHQAVVNLAISRHHTIAGYLVLVHIEILGAVGHEFIFLNKSARIKQ